MNFSTMQFLGGKLSAAQLQVAGWMGSVRRSLQGALDLVWGNPEEKQEDDNKDKEEEEEESGDGEGRFQRAMSPLRSFARRSRRSLRRISVRSRQTLQRRTTETCSAQVSSYVINSEDKDTDSLIDSVPDQQNGFCEQTTDSVSPEPVPEHTTEVSTEEVDASDSHKEPDFAPFPESSTPLLDTSAQKSKADLSRRRSRTRPSRSLRLAQTKSPNWRIYASTEENELSTKQDDSEPQEKQPKLQAVSSPSSTSQRVPSVPGRNPAALIAQLKRRSGGGVPGKGEVKEEVKQREEKESQHEEVAPSPSQLPRSPRNLAGAALVLPPLGGAEGGAVSSPAWLKELKSKKRLSQYDSEA